VEIVYDELKRLQNKAKHGFDFKDLNVEFFAEAAIVRAKGDRLMAIGWFGEGIVAVVYRPLGIEAISVVSMRVADRKERRIL
jgi:uncharacterized protein